MANFGTEVEVLASEVTERAVCGAVITATTLGWGAGVPKGKRVTEDKPEDGGYEEIDCVFHANGPRMREESVTGMPLNPLNEAQWC